MWIVDIQTPFVACILPDLHFKIKLNLNDRDELVDRK